jgi:hypothetical protein
MSDEQKHDARIAPHPRTCGSDPSSLHTKVVASFPQRALFAASQERINSVVHFNLDEMPHFALELHE